jgi:hypothetical protein
MSFSLHNQFQLGLSNDPSYLFTAARFLALDSNPPRQNLADQREQSESSAVPVTDKLTNPSSKLSLIQGVGINQSPFISSSASLFAGSSRAFGFTTGNFNQPNNGTLGATTWISSDDNTGRFDSIKIDEDGTPLPSNSLPDYGSTYSKYNTPCDRLPGPNSNFPPAQIPVLPIQSVVQNTPYSNCPGTVNDQPFKIASLVSPVENEIFYNPDADGIISGDLKIIELPKMIGGNFATQAGSPYIDNNNNFTVTYATGEITIPVAGNFGTISITLIVNNIVVPGDENSVSWSVTINTPNTTPMGVDTVLKLTANQLYTDLSILGTGQLVGDLVIRLTEDNFANGTPFTDRNPKNLGKLKNISVLQPKIINAAGQKAFTQQISKTNENIFQLPGDFTPTLILPPAN